MNINEIELACNLATSSTQDELVINSDTNLEEYATVEDLVEYRDDDTETLYWKEYPQEVFNRWYDYYLGEIEKCKV